MPAQVHRLGHVVLQTTKYIKALNWYLDNLGMIVSDFLYYPGQRDRGPLCPNPFLANRNHLDTELWTGFALITTTPLSSSERVLLEERGAIVHTAEPGSELADWLRRGHATAAIVRPDRTVMRASRNARALCEAMPVFCGTGESLSAATQSAPTGGRDHLGLFLPDLDDEFRDTP